MLMARLCATRSLVVFAVLAIAVLANDNSGLQPSPSPPLADNGHTDLRSEEGGNESDSFPTAPATSGPVTAGESEAGDQPTQDTDVPAGGLNAHYDAVTVTHAEDASRPTIDSGGGVLEAVTPDLLGANVDGAADVPPLDGDTTEGMAASTSGGDPMEATILPVDATATDAALLSAAISGAAAADGGEAASSASAPTPAVPSPRVRRFLLQPSPPTHDPRHQRGSSATGAGPAASSFSRSLMCRTCGGHVVQTAAHLDDVRLSGPRVIGTRHEPELGACSGSGCRGEAELRRLR
jgi:hypothetical protein